MDEQKQDSRGSEDAGPIVLPTILQATKYTEPYTDPALSFPEKRLVTAKKHHQKTTMVVRYIDPWSVFKIATLVFLFLYVVLLVSGVLLWNVASSTGTVQNVERWFTQFGWETFEINSKQLFDGAKTAGLFIAISLTGVCVIAAALFNVISDIVGGLRLYITSNRKNETSNNTDEKP